MSPMETVHPIEALWVLSALVTVVLAGRGGRKWSRVVRKLSGDEDKGARLLAEMISVVCWGLMAVGVFEIAAAVPSLLLPPRPDAPTSELARAAQVWAPACFIATNAAVSWVGWWIGYRTRNISRPREPYNGADRRHP